MARLIYKIKLLTPVHIGSGAKYSKIDTLIEGDKLYVIDIDKVVEKLYNFSAFLNKIQYRDFSIKEFLKENKIKSDEVLKYSIKVSGNFSNYRDISEFIKDGMGKPFIPGSSIKGAIRTVILWHLIKNSNTDVINRKLDEILENDSKDILMKYLFGDSPNYDLMRTLQIKDSFFSIDDLRLKEVKVFDLKYKYRFGWWKYRNPISDNYNKATSSYLEFLEKDSQSKVEIKIDEFLINKKEHLKFGNKVSHLLNIARKCNEYAEQFIDSEIKFFENCKFNELRDFYNKLKKEITSDNNSFILHLGWGSGWKGMTGNYLNKEYLTEFRRKFRLGKIVRKCPVCNGNVFPDKKDKRKFFCPNCRRSFFKDKIIINVFPIFPKTRKIIFENNKPVGVSGWIKLEVTK